MLSLNFLNFLAFNKYNENNFTILSFNYIYI